MNIKSKKFVAITMVLLMVVGTFAGLISAFLGR